MATVVDKWVWRFGGMKNPSALIKTSPTSTIFTANSTCTGLEWKPDPCGERPATNRQSHGTAFDGGAK